MAVGAPLLGTAGNAFSGLMGGVSMIFLVVIAAGIFFGFLFLILYILKFRIRVDVEEQRGDSIVEYPSRGGIIEDRKTKLKELVVWRKKSNPFKPIRGAVPNNESFRQTDKGKTILRLYKDSEDAYKVIPPIKPSEVKEKAVDTDWLNWGTLSLKGKAERFRKDAGFAEKYGVLIGYGMVAMIMIFGIIYGFDGFEKISEANARAAASNAESAKALTDSGLQLKGVQSLEQDDTLQKQKQGDSG